MKLYTEEQVIHAIKMARSSTNIFTTPFLYDKEDILEYVTPIELPTDEEIENEVDNFRGWVLIEKDFFKSGAKWMRNKILKK